VSLRARQWPLPLLSAGAFFAFGLATLRDYGMTWDEAETWNASASNLATLLGTSLPWAATHVLPGYYFAVDTLRALVFEAAGAFGSLADPDDRIAVHHAFTLLLASASVGLLCALVEDLSGRRRMAVVAAGALALMPPFFGHAQNNPKDIPAVFAFLLAGFCLARLARVSAAGGNAWGWVCASALALGVALTTRVLCVALFPIFGGWLWWRRPAALKRVPLHWVVLVAAAGAATFALWPWLWDAPLEKLGEISGRLAVHELVDFQIMYLGELRSWTEMPWHYRPVHLLIGLPLAHLLLAALSLAPLARWRAQADARFDVVALAAIWLGVLALIDQLAPYRYDGLRHFLPALPAVAMLVAAGSEWLCDAIGSRVTGSARHRTLAANAPVLVFFAAAALPLVSTHPHQSAFRNAVANAIAGPHSEEWIEAEYWGQAYREGGRWIGANTEPDAIVYLPIGDKIAGYYARRSRGAWNRFDARFARTERPQYVMFITRVGFYDDSIRRLERDYEAVYTVQVQNATLLKIYSNRRMKREAAAGSTHG
jgi:hypothetical protein